MSSFPLRRLLSVDLVCFLFVFPAVQLGGMVSAAEGATGGAEKLIYSNTLGRTVFGPPDAAPGLLIADDLSLAAPNGCHLDRYVIKVSGDRDQDGSGVGPYSVDVALYDMCPGAGSATPIAGTECHFDFPDNGTNEATCSIPPGVDLPIPNNLYLGVSFSRPRCGVFAGAPALVGFSADSMDFPGFPCDANLGGFLPAMPYGDYGTHASFHAQIYTRGDCPDAYPAHKNSMHAGDYYTPGGGIRFADDISLAMTGCQMVSLEVAFTGAGVVQFDLRSHLDDADPVNGGVIPGTQHSLVSTSGDVTVGRWNFDPPVLLPSTDLWVGFQTTSAVSGPVITEKRASLGGNDPGIAVHNGTQWMLTALPDGRYGATDVIIHCAESPPTGACCDMVFTTNHECIGGSNDGGPCENAADCPGGTCIGDSVCRDNLPEMNCPFPTWMEGESCDPDPFIRPCGLSACCTVTDECFDLTEKECFAVPPIEKPGLRMFQPGAFCGLAGQRCPFGACLAREGDCFAAHAAPGCDDPFCCTEVCINDPFCCLAVWDVFCVDLALEVCLDPDDCNDNGVPDDEDIAQGTSDDCQPDGIPDECQVPPIDPTGSDCNWNIVPDECELDTDGDGSIDDCDGDDDNDGVSDAADSDPLDPDLCEDADADGCDDCAVGTDDFGPLPDNDPDNDGTDTDADGVCDVGDPDDDNDGVLDGEDTNPLDPNLCQDVDSDGCDDCAIGVDGFGPLSDNDPDDDGIDTDMDGTCNFGDSDDDNDGVLDGDDTDPLDPVICEDVDTDGCDDCAVGVDGFGPLPDNDPDNDGPDADADGTCDASDGCPDDPEKVDPGICGCGVPDVDSDSDTVADCIDQCPGDDDLVDENQNGTPDCLEFEGIPAVSNWGLLVTALVLLILAKSRFGRRHAPA